MRYSGRTESYRHKSSTAVLGTAGMRTEETALEREHREEETRRRHERGELPTGEGLARAEAAMNDLLSEPDTTSPPPRCSLRRESPHYQSPRVTAKIEVWLSGVKRPSDVVEYSVPDGYIVTLSGTTLHGDVVTRWRPTVAPPRPSEADLAAAAQRDQDRLRAAEDKRRRRAEKTRRNMR